MSSGLPSLRVPLNAPPVTQFEVSFQIDLIDAVATAPDVEQLVRTFVAPGAFGGYAAPNATAERSRLEIVEPSGPLSFRLAAENVDARAFQVLRNMSALLATEQARVSKIAVRDLTGGTPSAELEPADDQNEDRVYPAVSNRLRFQVEWVNTQFSMARRCEIEFARPLNSDEVLQIAQRVATWDRLLEAGGFALPAGFPDEVTSIRGAVTQFDAYSVEVAVTRFQASETAWNVLVNLIGAYNQTDLSVVKIVVE